MAIDNWQTLTSAQALEQLKSQTGGLTHQDAQHRLNEQGPNELPQQAGRNLLQIILRQFSDFMILVLLGAAVVSGILGDPIDAIAILVILLLNAAIGVIQELRAEKAIAALRKMAAPEARVLRDNKLIVVPASELVRGDVVQLEAGNIVPADLRLLAVEELEADESALTGESMVVSKSISPLAEQSLPLGDQVNIAFKSSVITRGKGSGVVIATGLQTEIGKIAGLLQNSPDAGTPLQLRLASFGRYLAISVLAICSIVFLTGLLQGEPWLLMLLTSVSLAVAAIPEALPAVVAISLALGAHKLIRNNTLVRNLPAVETLGSVTYICSDKTGTLTQNMMTAETFWLNQIETSSLPHCTEQSALQEFGRAMAISNDVTIEADQASGEPTELALYQAARQYGYDKRQLEDSCPRIGAIPFDSSRKQMSTLHQIGSVTTLYSKGAPEAVIPKCRDLLTDHGNEPLNVEQTLERATLLANQGYRVLALAKAELSEPTSQLKPEIIERGLTLLGLVALIDPPREEAARAIEDCLTAGITPVMITGDHPGTALAIARRLGITHRTDSILTGAELANLEQPELERRVRDLRIYARVSPEQKLLIVQALQQQQEFVAMTGDGVNDAPALQTANIGIAMGKKGTDVAREASDMVLLDDNFASIVKAIKSGRRIFDNIRKFIKYTMTSNSGEIWTLFLAPLMGLPIPLLPIHILWINLVTDGLPGLAFTAEPEEKDVMKRPPRPPNESIFARGMWQHILWGGLFMGGLAISIQAWALSQELPYWQTMVFTVLTLSQLFQALAVRGESTSLFRQGLLSNRSMLGAVLLTVLLQLTVIYVPYCHGIFNTQALPIDALLLCIGVSSLMLVAVEIEKWLVRRRIS